MTETLIGLRIRERRRAAGLRQAELARRMGISASYLNLIERNRRRASPDIVARAARALEIAPAELDGAVERRLADRLAELAAEAELADLALDADSGRALLGRHPGWARALLRAWTARAEAARAVEALSDRLAHDPFLSSSVHAMLDRVAAIRSASEILASVPDIEPAQRARFHALLAEESARLAEVAGSLAAFFDGAHREAAPASPAEEVEEAFLGAESRFPALEPQAAPPPAPAEAEGVRPQAPAGAPATPPPAPPEAPAAPAPPPSGGGQPPAAPPIPASAAPGATPSAPRAAAATTPSAPLPPPPTIRTAAAAIRSDADTAPAAPPSTPPSTSPSTSRSAPPSAAGAGPGASPAGSPVPPLGPPGDAGLGGIDPPRPAADAPKGVGAPAAAVPPGAADAPPWARVDAALAAEAAAAGLPPPAAETPETLRLARAEALAAALSAAAVEAEIAARPRLAAPAVARRARAALLAAAADARLAPAPLLLAEGEAVGWDLDRLARRFALPPARLMRRLTALPAPAPRAAFLRVDAAGQALERRLLPGLALPRLGAGCPLWAVHRALSAPGRTLRQLAVFPRGEVWVLLGHAAPAAAPDAPGAPPPLHAALLALPEAEARRTVYAPAPRETPEPVGPSCRVCPREACAHRAEDPVLG